MVPNFVSTCESSREHICTSAPTFSNCVTTDGSASGGIQTSIGHLAAAATKAAAKPAFPQLATANLFFRMVLPLL